MATVAIGFQGRNERAQRVAKKRAASMVTRISKETREAVRSIVVRSIAEGIPPYEAARLIRGVVGLSWPQTQAVKNYRGELIDSGLTLQRVNTLVDKYADRKLRERAATIARTEIVGALNEGSLQAFREARSDGLLSDTSTKGVVVTDDERLCPICAPLEAETQPLDRPFSTGDMAPPFHPNCRCSLVANP